MDKGKYKNSRHSEGVKVGEVAQPLKGAKKKKEIKNSLTLTSLLKTEPTEKDYDVLVELLSKLAKSTWDQYKFFIAKSSDETQEPNFVQLVSPAKEDEHTHKLIFSRAIDSNADMPTLQQKFADHVAAGKVIDLGEDVVIITNDGSGQLPTGVSPINNGLEGSEITFIISFIQKENLEAFMANKFPEEEENE